MQQLIKLLNIIYKEKIILEDIKSSSQYAPDGIYFNIPGFPPVIGIKSSIFYASPKYISTLGEEVGHHFTTLGNLTIASKNYSEKLLKNKKERQAKTWASNFLVSDTEFVQALNDCKSTTEEMAEHFNVTEELIKYKIDSIVSDEVKYNNIKKDFMKREIPYNSCMI